MQENDSTFNSKEEPDVPRKRFAITIMGTAEYHEESNDKFRDFQSWYNEYRQVIEKELNGIPGISVKSYLSKFELDDDIGQVQES